MRKLLVVPGEVLTGREAGLGLEGWEDHHWMVRVGVREPSFGQVRDLTCPSLYFLGFTLPYPLLPQSMWDGGGRPP